MIENKEIYKSFERYPAYKDSGVEWLGEIPEGWQVLPGLRFIAEGKEKNKGMIRDTVLSLSYGNIRVREKEELTGLVPESFETYQLVNKGDLIFRPTDLQNDKVSLRSSISNYEGIITSAYLNLRIKSKASSKFYHYLFRAIDNNKVIYGLGSGLRQNISYLDFRRFNFPFPPFSEQTTIANFLDDKTTKIDTAIAQKEKIIALLKERKQIVIQNAVTGKWTMIDGKWTETPKEQMKDSGVEWIGEIPEGWEVKRLSYITTRIGDGLHGTPEYTDDTEYYFINGNNLSTGFIEITEQTKTVSQKEYMLNKKDIHQDRTLLLSINGTIGNVAFYRNETVMLGKSAAYLNFINGVNLEFIKWFLMSESFINYYELELSGSTINNLSLFSIGKTPLTYPSKNEQERIVDYINVETLRIDRAITLQQSQIEKLKEYKATLIDGAVTGKIKVTDE